MTTRSEIHNRCSMRQYLLALARYWRSVLAPYWHMPGMITIFYYWVSRPANFVLGKHCNRTSRKKFNLHWNPQSTHYYYYWNKHGMIRIFFMTFLKCMTYNLYILYHTIFIIIIIIMEQNIEYFSLFINKTKSYFISLKITIISI